MELVEDVPGPSAQPVLGYIFVERGIAQAPRGTRDIVNGLGPDDAEANRIGPEGSLERQEISNAKGENRSLGMIGAGQRLLDQEIAVQWRHATGAEIGPVERPH